MSNAPKILAIDIGNSYTKIGCFIDGTLEEIEVFPTDRDDLSVYQEELEECMLQNGEAAPIDGAILSSVVPMVNPLFDNLLKKAYAINNVLWLEREKLSKLNLGGVSLSRYTPGELGTDRAANIVGGHFAYPEQRLVVCDFGTTTTFDMVEPDGTYLGGAICPGPRKFQSLVDSAHAAQLFEVDIFQKPEATPGRSTKASLQNGLYFGYKGILLEVFGNLLQESQWPLSQVTFAFTGGYAQGVRQMVEMEIQNVHIQSDLTLQGLYKIWELNPVPQAIAHPER